MDNAEFSQHTSRRFNEELEALRNHVLRMGGLVHEQLTRAIDAVIESDSALGLQVAHDDYKVNRMEVAIDEECAHILVRRAPAAMDLRLIVAVIKTITDLERVGDEAEKIGYLASRLAAMERPRNRYLELRNLGEHVSTMLTQSLDAFSSLDVDAARRVVAADKNVDHEYEMIARQSITFMMEDPRDIKRVMDVLWAARALERIGDHAKNICEYVIFLVLGKDIRHLKITNLDEDDAAAADEQISE
ncbi:MAG: phosphate signaling complex protein PhoU [Pseudomonadota bacterium]